MNPVTTAIWYIEQQSAEPLGLDEIARASGVSRFQLARAFSASTGRSVMRYVRGRRLSDAAQALANGAPDIMAVAVDAGYGSHEAFTRAFRERFGITPERVRDRGTLATLDLEEIVTMDQPLTPAAHPEFETLPLMRFAGLRERFTRDTAGAIPALWGRFVPYLDGILDRADDAEYGICAASADGEGMDYTAGVAVTSFERVAADLTRLELPARRYAVFLHEAHVARIRGTFGWIVNEWLPASGHRLADAPEFERYDARFDPRTGLGGVEIWMPLEA